MPRRRKSGVASLIDRYPVGSFIGAIVTACSITASIVAFVSTARLDRATDALKLDNQREQAKSATRIEQLERRILGIDRGISGQVGYLDIVKMTIAPAQVRTLPHTARLYENFYLVEPPTGPLEYSERSELDFARMLVGDGIREFPPTQRRIMENQRIHLWTTIDSERFNITDELTLFPYVTVESINRDALVRAGALGVKQADRDERKKRKRIARRIARLAPQVEEAARTPDADSSGGSHEITAHWSSKALEKFTQTVGEVFEAELTGFMLFVNLRLGFDMAVNGEARFEVVEVAKKSNVLYARFKVTFPEGAAGAPKGQPLVWDRELFLISPGGNLLMVQTSVPSFGGTSPAYVWVTEWLTELRVPLNL